MSDDRLGFSVPDAPVPDAPDVADGMLDVAPAKRGPGRPKGTNPGGRPKGFDGTRSKANSHVAQAFKKVGLDWREDLAKAIMKNDRYRIKLWLKLLPYLIVSSRRSKVKRWKGKPSKAALIALETLEGRDE